MTKEQLQARSRDSLAELARKKGIAGCSRMRKELVIAKLLAHFRRSPNGADHANGSATLANGAGAGHLAGHLTGANGKSVSRPQIAAARDTSDEEQIERSKYDVGIATKDLSAKVPRELPAGYHKDRIVLMVRDPYWLHVYWEVTRQAVQRAEAALGQDWHGAKPILRVLDVTCHDSNHGADKAVRDIDIHGGCNNWYVDVPSPARSYRIDIGYLSRKGQFYVLARSNVVATPRAGVSDLIDENWADLDTANADRIFAMSGGFDPTASSLELKQLFEERLHRPMGSPAVTSFGSGAMQFGRQRNFWFKLDAELVVYGATEPNATVTLQGAPIKLRPDGTFTMRFSLPDSRQIIPATAVSHDKVEERTIVLAIERNTRQLEPMIHEISE